MTAFLTATGVVRRWTGGRRIPYPDIEVAAGELVAVVGPNGSGKTTLLRLLAGHLDTSDGAIEVDGRMVSSRRPPDGVAFCGVSTALVPDLAVGDQVTYFGRLLGGFDPERLGRLVTVLDVEPLAGLLPRALSAGQRMRVALLLGLLPAARLYLLDEPTTSLDADGVGALVGVLRAEADAGAAVLVATHDDRLSTAADRTIALV